MKQTTLIRRSLLAVALIGVALPTLATGDGPVDRKAVRAILERFALDYQEDPSIAAVAFGIEVEAEWWSVTATPGVDKAPARVVLQEGPPAEPTFYFTLDRETLGKLDRGQMNAETAMVKAFSTDPSPMDIEVMEGFQPGPDFVGVALPATFHFWTRGLPEVIPFGESYTRFTHGADATVFYYQPGFRSGWGSLKKGQHANEDPRSQTNPFPSLVIVTQGAGTGRIGGKEIELKAGQAVLIPTEVSHEFWNHNDAPMEFVLVMFGDGA
jgi:mannose-6-phosphate isomerase-like protein (cupin superfamily)